MVPYLTCCLKKLGSIIQLHTADGSPSLIPSDQTEIRIGTTMPAGPTDFSQLELVGTFDNPQAFEMRVIEVNPPKSTNSWLFWKRTTHVSL